MGYLRRRAWGVLASAGVLAALFGTYPFVRHGLRGTYYHTTDWSGERTSRVDPMPSSIGVDLALGPVAPQVLSVEWIGSLVVDREGTYQLRILTTAPCLVAVGERLTVDSRIGGVPEVSLEPGVYTFSIRCTSTQGLHVSVLWDRAGPDPRALTPDILFPGPITLDDFRWNARRERMQSVAAALALAIALLLVVDWARRSGPIAVAIAVSMVAMMVAFHFDWPLWLRGPREWQWGRKDPAIERSLFPALVFGFSLCGVIALLGTRAARRAPRAAAAALLATGMAAGVAFHLAVLDVEPGGWRQTLVDRVWQDIGLLRSAAIVNDVPLGDLVRHYSEYMPRLSFRGTTHPPGGTLLFRVLIRAAQRAGVNGVDPEYVFGSSQVVRAAPMRSVALAGGLLWTACAALTAFPVALAVVVIGGDWLTAAAAGLVWVLTPSATFFTPWLDQLNTLLVTTSFALLLAARTARRRAAWSIAAGMAGGTALFFSYGTAPMLGAGVLMAGVVAASTRSLTRFASSAAFCALGFGLVIAAIELAGFPQLGVARAALRAHAAFTQGRQAGLWLWANWIDFAIYFGAASVVLLVATLTRRNGSGIAGRLTLCVVGVMIVTDLSGTSRGEVGRLWMPFMPLLIVAIWPPMVQSMLDSGRARPRDLAVVAMLLMVYSIELARHWMFW